MLSGVSSSYIDYLNSNISNPQRQFLIGTSDYSEYVIKWPILKRSVDISEIGTVKISLANVDGTFNGFYLSTYSVPNTIAIKLGFNSEYAAVYYGFVKKIDYSKDKCDITIKDRLYDFTQKRIASTNSVTTYSGVIPSDIAWDLCTCYGGLSNSADNANPDICYSSFLEWAGVFSADSLTISARFADNKVVNGLDELCKITDSGIWIGRDGKLYFKRFTTADSNSISIIENETVAFDIDIDDTRVVNKAFVDFDWKQESNYFASTISAINSQSRDSFGLREETYQSKIVWWVSSTDALNLANRQLTKYKDLPAYFDLTTGLKGFNMDLGETIQLTNSFYSVSSDQAWTIHDEEADLNDGFMKYNLRPAINANIFILDVTSLDGTEQLL